MGGDHPSLEAGDDISSYLGGCYLGCAVKRGITLGTGASRCRRLFHVPIVLDTTKDPSFSKDLLKADERCTRLVMNAAIARPFSAGLRDRFPRR